MRKQGAGNAHSEMKIRNGHADRIKVGREQKYKYDIGHWKIIIICYELLQS